MAVVADELLLNVKANVTQAMAGLSQVEEKGSGIGGAVKGGVKIAKRALVGLGVAAAGVGAVLGGFMVKGGIDRALQSEAAIVQMRRLGLATEEIDDMVQAVDKTFDGTVFSNPEGFALTQRLLGAGVELDAIPERLRTIADFAAHGNAPLDQMGDIFERIVSQGRVTGQELNRLAQSGIPLSQIAESLGMTVPELREMTSEGGFTADMFLEAASNAEVFDGAAKAAGDTTAGAFKNTLTQLKVLGEQLVKPLFGEDGPMVRLFQATRQALIDVRPWFIKAGEALAEWLVPKIEQLAGWLEGGGLPTLIERLSDKFSDWRPHIEGAAEWLGELWDKLKEGENPLEGFKDGLIAMGGPLMIIARELLPVLAPLFEAIIPPLAELATELAPLFGEVLQWFVDEVLPGFIKMVEAVIGWIKDNKGLVKAFGIAVIAFKILAAVMAVNPFVLLAAAVVAIASLIITHWDEIVDFLSDAWNWIKDTASDVWNAIKDTIVDAVTGARDWIIDKWEEIKGAFRGMFEGVVGALRGPFNAVIGFIEGGINKVIDLINRAIDKINTIPGVSFSKVGRVSIPRLAGGGVITRGGQALINDGTSPEQVGLSRGALVRPTSPGDTGGGGPLVHIEHMHGQDPHKVAADIGWELTKRGAA